MAGYTLFVGIDEYDAPANNSAFDGTGPESRQAQVAGIELFFKGSLFSILKAARGDGPIGCISNYFLTGVLSAFRAGTSQLTAVQLISGNPTFHGICGLTGQQVKIFAEAYLDP